MTVFYIIVCALWGALVYMHTKKEHSAAASVVFAVSAALLWPALLAVAVAAQAASLCGAGQEEEAAALDPGEPSKDAIKDSQKNED